MSSKAAQITTLPVPDASALPFPTQRPMLICLSGIDGAGKTRVAHRLEFAFQKQGIQARYQWLCGGSSAFSEIVVRLIRKAAGTRSSFPQRHPPNQRKGFRFQVKKQLWYLLVGIDLVQFSIFKVRLPLLLGKVVICDRYTFDTFSDVASRYEQDPACACMNPFEKFFHFLFPEPDLHYLLVANPDEVERPGRVDPAADEDFRYKSQLYLTRYQPYARFVVKRVDGDIDRVEHEIVMETLKRYWSELGSNGRKGN
ncbi:MAG TPA: hypothetical protein VGK99_20965 [Acidobacteriota bacterium]